MIPREPEKDTGMIIVIPCLNEPDIEATLNSILLCNEPKCHTEVITIINHSEQATESIKRFNDSTRQNLNLWVSKHNKDHLSFHVLGPVEFKKKWAGAGLARKLGMDEAVSRFNRLNKPDGIITSLDADTLVDANYLQEIENHYKKHAEHVGATIAFRHRKEGLEERHLRGIELYESYLEYYKLALAYTGYPYSMFTIGSAFSVRAEAYVKRGGMNRRQAGEDFYFLQNLAHMGKIGEISSTCVMPSARISDRVPFGTGPVLRKWLKEEEDLTVTYDLQAFLDLKVFFDRKDQFFQVEYKTFERLMNDLPEPLREFLSVDDFYKELDDLSNNCSTPESFGARFFQKFNAFKVLRFLNFTHEKYYSKADLEGQRKILFRLVT